MPEGREGPYQAGPKPARRAAAPTSSVYISHEMGSLALIKQVTRCWWGGAQLLTDRGRCSIPLSLYPHKWHWFSPVLSHRGQISPEAKLPAITPFHFLDYFNIFKCQLAVSVRIQQALRQLETPGPIDQTPCTFGSDKNPNGSQ